jgi:hypothetical protein
MSQSRPSVYTQHIYVSECLGLPKYTLARLPLQISQPHTAQAEHGRARERSGVCCLMQSFVHESTRAHWCKLGGLAEAIIQT